MGQASAVLPATPSPNANVRHIVSPTWDGALLGGGSLLALLAIRMILKDSDLNWSFMTTLMLANIINNPHFAHSYQIFYRNFWKKITAYPENLRWRYVISGLVVPVGLICFFATAVVSEKPRLLGISANLMFFLVGWHYVKQGYGMAMVDAVLKRAFYNDRQKQHLLHNAYATWIFSWLYANYNAPSADPQYFGVPYFLIPVPTILIIAAGLVCAFTSIRLYITMRKRALEGHAVAWNGLLAYVVSVYAWLLIRDPIVLLWIPLFHSLQYLTVVWRYEINRVRSVPSKIRPVFRFMLFAVLGIGLGYWGFFALPEWLNENVHYANDLFGTNLFMYLFWIFINIHHYSLDAVMWRKGNPDVQAHLFSH